MISNARPAEKKNTILFTAVSGKKPSARHTAKAARTEKTESACRIVHTEGRCKSMDCFNCFNTDCSLCGEVIANVQKCLRCTFAAEPAGENCRLCFAGDCGYEERVD